MGLFLFELRQTRLEANRRTHDSVVCGGTVFLRLLLQASSRVRHCGAMATTGASVPEADRAKNTDPGRVPGFAGLSRGRRWLFVAVTSLIRETCSTNAAGSSGR